MQQSALAAGWQFSSKSLSVTSPSSVRPEPSGLWQHRPASCTISHVSEETDLGTYAVIIQL